MEAEAALCVNLEHNTEAYLVHLFARHLDKPLANDPVCLTLMKSVRLAPAQKRNALLPVAEECLLITGLELSKRRWPSENYYIDMGRTAYYEVADLDRPADALYTSLAENFTLLSKVINKCKIP